LRRSAAAAEVLGGIARRALDLIVGLVMTLLSAPVAFGCMLWGRLRGRGMLEHDVFVGRQMRPIDLGRIPAPGPLARIPWLWAVVRGDLSLVGPAPLPWSQTAMLRPQDLVRFQVRPGLADLFTIRASANIAFEDRALTDAEQIHTSTVIGDLGILARSIPAALMGGGPVTPPESLRILDVAIDNWTMGQAVDWILSPARGVTRQLAFVNPDCLNKACEDDVYRRILDRSAVVLPDGIGIHYACRIMGTALAANVNGTDLFPRLCDAMAGTEHSVYLLGGRPGVTDALVEAMAQRWPRVRVAGHRHGFFERGGDEETAIVNEIRTSGADVLLVAFGVPLQERWIDANADRLGVRVAMGVGGLFDFYSGRIPRAPVWLRELGFEWVWRLLQEPGRMWRRYVIGNPLFLWRVWRWNAGGSSAHPRHQHSSGSA
jgi:N-acetylglucosaminyldiphosphoundecaprenol N-acetyl-beta-D-mannosaminyltransferase